MTTSTLMNKFCENLDIVRKQRGLTQSELAELIGTKQSAVSRLLSGGEDITLSRCERIAEILEIDVQTMLFGDVSKKFKNHRSVILT